MIRFFICLLFFCSASLAFSQVGIGTITPSDASMLDVNSTLDSGITYKGFMPPRIPLTSDLVKINAGINDAGLQVFILETGCLNIWSGLAWVEGPCVNIVTGSEVEFTAASQSQLENVPAIDFDFTIANPSPTETIVVSISADTYADLDELAAQTVTIPAGATSFTANGVFNITNDAAMEPSEDVVFTVTYVSGGLGTTSIGAQSTHTLTILDDDSAITLTLPFQESFETNGNGTRYTTSITEQISGADYFSRGEESDFLNVTFGGTQDGAFLFAAQDIDGLGGASQQTLTISDIDITGGTNLLFEVLLVEDDQGTNEHWDGSDFVHFDYQIDGTGYLPLLWIESQNGTNNAPQIDTDFDGIGDGATITSTWSDISRSIPTTGGTLDIRITIDFNSANEDIGIDNIRVTSN